MRRLTPAASGEWGFRFHALLVGVGEEVHL